MISERLKWLREQKKLSHEAAAAKIGVSLRSLFNHEAGKKPGKGSLKLYIDFYGCDRNWLVTGEGDPFKKEEMIRIIPQDSRDSMGNSSSGIELYSQVEIPKRDLPDVGDFALVPMAEAHLSAGGGAFVLSENIKEYYAFRKEWIKRTATGRDNLVMMAVRGYSMEPTILAGDMVLIDTGRKQIYDGNIYALGLNETIVIKRLELLSGGRVRIFGDNTSPEYTPETAHLGQVRVIGQVIWFARELVRGEE